MPLSNLAVRFYNQYRGLALQFHIFSIGGYTKYCGNGIWYKTGDTSNKNQLSGIL